jgi:hypothetical protein
VAWKMRTYVAVIFHSKCVLTQTERSQQLAQDSEIAHPQIIESSNLESAVERLRTQGLN